MTKRSTTSPKSVDEFANNELIDGILDNALKVAQRNVEQFAKLAALARAIEQCNSSPATRARLLFSFDELASSAEADAKLDVEFFEGLRNGQLMKNQLRLEHQHRADGVPEFTILAPSTETKH